MKVHVKLYQYNVKSSDGRFFKLRSRAFSDDVLGDASEKAEHYRKNLEVEHDNEFTKEVIWEGKVEVSQQDIDSVTTPRMTDETLLEEQKVSSNEFVDEEPKENYPKGWHRKKEFVAKDGTVYHIGEEFPELYRKRTPTDY